MATRINRSRLFRRIFLVTVLLTPLHSGAQEQTTNLQQPLGASESGQRGALITITGYVIDDATGEPVQGARVSLLDRSAYSDGQGAFAFSDVPSSRSATLNVRTLNSFGTVTGCVHIEVEVTLYPLAANLEGATAIVNLETTADIEVTLRLAPLSGEVLDEQCSECHKPNPCLIAVDSPEQWDTADYMVGIAVPLDEYQDFVDKIQAEGLTSDMYTSLRYQDAHVQGVKMPGGTGARKYYKKPDVLPMGNDNTLHCDTCHTRHESTPFGAFSRLDFTEESTLCTQCHL